MTLSLKDKNEILFHLQAGLQECGIPDYMHEGMELYILHGKPPGDFLTAVLSNDLREACLRADDVNRWHLHNYVRFLFCYAPFGSWGSEKAFKDWTAQRGLNAER